MNKYREHIKKLTLSGIFLALALTLPFLTGQLESFGNMLCPMHLPVLLCGMICGPVFGATVGATAPILRFLIFGLPPLFPIGLPMAFELLTYGLVSGILVKKLGGGMKQLYVSLICAMLCGRVIWGIARFSLSMIQNSAFGLAAFISGAFTEAIPGIIIQLIIIPILVRTVKRMNNS